MILLGNAEKSPEICGSWGEIKEKGSQTEEELQGLIDRVGDRASCWGPICGLGQLFSFDFDWPFIYGLWHQHFGERAQTLTYETPNMGARPFFLTTEKMEGDPFESTLHTEFKGNHFVACGGYAHNVDGELRPYKLAKDQSIKRDDQILKDSTRFLHELLEGRYSWLRYKCIRERLSSKRIVLTHKQGLALNGFMLMEGCEDFEIHNFRRTCYDVDEAGKHRLEYDQKTTQTQVDSGRKYLEGGGLPFPCRQTETNEGLAATFGWDLAGCAGCPRRAERGDVGAGLPLMTRPSAAEAAVEVGETFTYTGDRPFLGRVQVTALGRPMSRYLKLTFRCGKDDDTCVGCPLNGSTSLNFTSTEIDPSAFASYFDTDNPRNALRVLMERGLKLNCMAWLKSARIEGSDERAVTPAIVIDLQGTEGRAWFVHGPRCDLSRAPNWVTATGWLCHGNKGRIGVLVTEFTTESEVAVPTDEELAEARSTLQRHVDTESRELKDSAVWRIADALKTRSQLKGDEIVKGYVSDVLTAGSPTWVKTPEGAPQLGATTNELGPTTTAKSQRERELIAWLGAGRYHAGRMTEAGLTAGAEQVKDLGWILRKGLLPSMDLSLIILDNMPPHNLDRQIESRRNGIVQLAAMKGAELWARCRLKLLGNPVKPFDETLHRCVALKVYDSKLIARFAFAVFTYGVSVEERYNPKLQIPLAVDEEILEAARTIIRWNMSKERTYTTRPEHWPLIMKLGRQLEEEFGCEDIPLLLRSTPYKLAVVAYPFALLEGFEEPEERHIRLAYKWLRFCALDIELDTYVDEWRRRHELSDAEYEKIQVRLQEQFLDEVKIHGGTEEETETYRIIEYVAKHASATRDEVAGYINMVPKTVTEKTQLLKGLGILRSDKDGYHFTAKGVRFLRRWMPERRQVTDVTDVTGPVRTNGLPTESGSAESLGSPPGGNMSNIGNLGKPEKGEEPPATGGTPEAEEDVAETGAKASVSGAPPPDPFEAVMGIWTGLERDGEGTALLEGLAELLMRSGFPDPYGLVAEALPAGHLAREGWRIELVGAELRPQDEEGECAACSRPGQLYADHEGVWPVCLRCRLGLPATKSGLPWRFRVVTR